MPEIDYNALAMRVYEQMHNDEDTGTAQLYNQICRAAIHATILTLKEYERLQGSQQAE